MIEMETFSEQQLQTDRQLLLTFDRGQVHLFPLWSSSTKNTWRGIQTSLSPKTSHQATQTYA